MRKTFRRTAALLLAAILAVGVLAVPGFAMARTDKDEVTYTTAPEVYSWIYQNYTNGAVGTFTITKGELTYESNVAGYEEPVVDHVPVYVVAMAGTEDTNGMDNNAASDLKSGLLNLTTPYEVEVREAILKDVPKGSNLYLTGHSLGGMTAQQLAADPVLKENYNILFAVAFGSPLISPFGREGYVVRLVDKYDWVQYASVNNIIASQVDPLGLMSDKREETHFSAKELIAYYSQLSKDEDAKKMAALVGDVADKQDPPKPGEIDDPIWYVHDASYASEKTWGQYDVTGRTDHNTTLTLYPKTTKFYKANLEAVRNS